MTDADCNKERVTMRRLDPERDEALVREAVGWIDRQPRWFREFEEEFGASTRAKLAADMERPNQSDFGVFDDERLIGLITVVLHGNGLYEAHFRAARHCNYRLIITAAGALRDYIFTRLGALEIFGFIPSFNGGAIRLAEAVGLHRDGVREAGGRLRGRSVEWVRLSISRSWWEAEYGEEKDNSNDESESVLQQSEYLLVDAAHGHSRHSGAPRL